VPREPVRTTLRFAASAPLRSAPSGVRSGTHSRPNVSTGKHYFNNSGLTDEGPPRCYKLQENGMWMVRYLKALIEGSEEHQDEKFYVNVQ